MRMLLLFCYVAAVMVVSSKNWYKGLCLALPVLAILERKDMPRGLLNIDGLNVFNVMLLCVLLAYLSQHRKEKLSYRGSVTIKNFFNLYMIIFIISFSRMIFDYNSFHDYYSYIGGTTPSIGTMFTSELAIRFKWIVFPILICMGVNSDERAKACLVSIVITGLLLALQVISRMYPALLGADDLATRALRVIDRNIGYHRTDLAGILGGSAWGSLALVLVHKGKMAKLFFLTGFFLITIGLFLTGSRAAYGAWVICGGVMMWLRWRKLIWLAPPALMLALTAIPGLQERLTAGFTEDSTSGYAEKTGSAGDGADLYQITSGRAVVWPVVVESIGEAPLFGYGMRGFQRLNLKQIVVEEFNVDAGVGIPHSHNAFLEYIIDNGLIGFIPMMILYCILLSKAKRVFADKNADKLEVAKAAFVLSFCICTLLGYMGQGYMYPQQSAILMYCSVAVFIGSSSIMMAPQKKSLKNGREQLKKI